jgi:hypothetical protein
MFLWLYHTDHRQGLKQGREGFRILLVFKPSHINKEHGRYVGAVCSRPVRPLLLVSERIRIWMFLGLLDPDPDPVVRRTDPNPSIIKQK